MNKKLEETVNLKAPGVTRKVLIAEDDEALGNLIREALEANGYEVDLVGDGKSALEKFNEDPTAIVVTDMEMPVMDGYELITHLKEAVDEPVIFVITANNDAHFIIDVMKKGVYDYLIKPLDLTDLIMKVNRAVESYELKRMKRIVEKEKDIRLKNQLEWANWQKRMEVKDGKMDKSLFQNMHISFSQGAGFGALITLVNLLSNLSRKKGDHYEIPSDMMETVIKNARIAENAVNSFSDIEWIISNRLNVRKISCVELHDSIIEVKNLAEKKSHLNENRIMVSDRKDSFSRMFVNVDEKYFQKALNEILINAMKFSERGSDIYMIFDVNSDGAFISVINTPMKDEEGRRGIPMDYENLIFEPFFRLFHSVREEFGSFDYGLGLTLVEKIIEKHNGKIVGRNITDHTDFSKGPVTKVDFNITLPVV